jgi:hypothetical protein
MVDNSDYIPANAIRFVGELRAEINRLIETETSGPEYDDAVDKFDVARRDVDLFFRNELRHGALDARQRDPYTGEEMRVSAKDWENSAILPGEDLAFPPIYFWEAEFDPWLKKAKGDIKKHGRRPSAVETAKRVITALYPNGVPKQKSIQAVTGEVDKHCRERGEIPPSYSSVERALGRRI